MLYKILKTIFFTLLTALFSFDVWLYFHPKHSQKNIECKVITIQNDTINKVYIVPSYAQFHLYRDMLQYTTETGAYITVDRNIQYFEQVK